jgi:hypothetical protein
MGIGTATPRRLKHAGGIMDAETRMERKVAAKDRKYSLRYRPKQVGRSVFTILQVQAKRAEQTEQVKGGRVDKPSRPRVFAESVFSITG